MSSTHITSAARQILNQFPKVTRVNQGRFENLLAAVAGLDGNRSLSASDAQALADRIESIKPGATRLLKKDILALQADIDAYIAEQPMPGVDIAFTSAGQNTRRFRGEILNQIDEALTDANGEHVDVDILIFSFTDKILADELLSRAEQHDNLTIRVLTDWSQLPTSGSRQPTRLHREAQARGIDNLIVKYKKDNPYVWDATNERPKFSHGATDGLNHHKGLVISIANKPVTLMSGSFNWSLSAMRNYENMMTLKDENATCRDAIRHYRQEFGALWNENDFALTYDEARAYKNELYSDLFDTHGIAHNIVNTPIGHIVDPVYVVPADYVDFDINVPSDDLIDWLSRETAQNADIIVEEYLMSLQEYGRYQDWEELVDRCPAFGRLPSATQDNMNQTLQFGKGKLALNQAGDEVLENLGLSASARAALSVYLTDHGAMESFDELDFVSGLSDDEIQSIRLNLSASEIAAFFSGTIPGGVTSDGLSNRRDTWTIPSSGNILGDEGGLESHRINMLDVDATLSIPFSEVLLRAQPGETAYVAMYGLSTNTEEFAAIEEAAHRGVHIEVVLHKSYNAGAFAALSDLEAQGLPVKTFKINSKTMHQKFIVVGDDVCNGSANASRSSVNKHAEDRFLLRNIPSVAKTFMEEFELLKANSTRQP